MDFQNQDDLQVQKILDKKVFNGKTLYLVKWKNYPIEQATWECNKILMNVKEKIREFKYSKRATEQIPNIKFQEDLPEGQIRDTFKRKRGRPPRLSFNSYRQAAHRTNQKNTEGLINSLKRGRGRPRGSKNKRPRNVDFQAQSQESFDSNSAQKSQNQERTLTNDDQSIGESDDNGMKKLRKLKKIISKQKQRTINFKVKKQDERQLDIVDSEGEINSHKMNQNQGQKIGFQSSVLIDISSSFHEKQDEKLKSGNKQKVISDFKIQKKNQRQLKDEELYCETNPSISQKRIVRKDQKKLIQVKSVGTISNQKEFDKLKAKQNKTNDINRQLEKFQQKYFKRQKEKHPTENQKSLLKQGQIKQKNMFCPHNSLKSSNLTQKKNTLKNNEKKLPQRTQISSNETHNNKFQNKQFIITKIYHLQTIQLSISRKNEQFQNEQFAPYIGNSLSDQQLRQMSLSRQIVEIFSRHLNFRKNIFLSKQVENILTNKSRAIYDNIWSILSTSPQRDNETIIEQLRQKYFQQNIQKFLKYLPQTVDQALYLVEFNQGNIIKKMTASDLNLYILIDMIRTTNTKSEQNFKSLSNMAFYFKFLQRSFVTQNTKNQLYPKTQNFNPKNLKLEHQNNKNNLQLQGLLIEALKNVKTKTSSNRYSNGFQPYKKKKPIDINANKNIADPVFSQNESYKDIFPTEDQKSLNTTKIQEKLHQTQQKN